MLSKCKGLCQQPFLSSAKLVEMSCVPQAGPTRHLGSWPRLGPYTQERRERLDFETFLGRPFSGLISPWFLATQKWESDGKDACLVTDSLCHYSPLPTLCPRHPHLLAVPQSCQTHSNLRAFVFFVSFAPYPPADSLNAFRFLLKWPPHLNFHT